MVLPSQVHFPHGGEWGSQGIAMEATGNLVCAACTSAQNPFSEGSRALALMAVGWASSREAKDCRFDSWWGHMPGLWAPSPVGMHVRGNPSMSFSY